MLCFMIRGADKTVRDHCFIRDNYGENVAIMSLILDLYVENTDEMLNDMK